MNKKMKKDVKLSPSAIIAVGFLLLILTATLLLMLPISAQNGDLLAEPEIITRGFIYVKDSEELLQDLRNLTMSTAEAYRGKRGRDLNELKGAIRSAVSNYLFKATKRSPMVLPVITRL